MKVLPNDFFAVSAPELAMRLIGCELHVRECAVRIVETEAYTPDDQASHSYRGPRGRAEVMYRPVGTIYVYRSYGMHHCINIVCAGAAPGSAVLIRAGEPLEGAELMAQRRRVSADRRELSNGPGKLAEALHVTTDEWNGKVLGQETGMWIEAGRPAGRILQTRRIGISRDADLLRRYLDPDSRYLLKRYL